MNKYFVVWFFCISYISAHAQDAIEAGTIQFSATEINFGLIEYDSNPFREVTVTNVGNYPLIINSCRASCGCTVPNCPTEAIAPKKKAVIKIRYNTTRVGQFSKTITVYSNDQKNPISLIKIYGEVKEPLTSSTVVKP
ncbi:MAG: DUF1573 domain-containing protein [Chitinophagales bacterium]|nr:DUF1573 domain-containing protein [Chitinophagales bacterium]